MQGHTDSPRRPSASFNTQVVSDTDVNPVVFTGRNGSAATSIIVAEQLPPNQLADPANDRLPLALSLHGRRGN